jgi:hypothetical protein
MKCATCRARDASVGLLCEACSEELSAFVIVSPQQIQAHPTANGPIALVDSWGHPYFVEPGTLIGRGPQAELVILEPSVSHLHAALTREGDTYIVRDLGSTWGTFVRGQRIDGEAAVAAGNRVRFGDVAFHFVVDLPPMPMPQRFDAPTYRAPQKLPEKSGGRPQLAMTLSEASGGGGMLVIGTRQVSLTAAQFELVTRLVERMLADEGVPEDERGYVAASELANLSLDTPLPNGDHVRQLVRRVRHALVKAQLGDLIESRRKIGGYRLRFLPVLATRPHR